MLKNFRKKAGIVLDKVEYGSIIIAGESMKSLCCLDWSLDYLLKGEAEAI